MIKASDADRERVISILADSFDSNKSVNYLIPQDNKRKERIRKLMKYSFNICRSFGRVILSDNKKACALILMPDKKQTTFYSIWWDIKLILTCTGIGNIRKILQREAKIKSLQPQQPIYYLWFIGVNSEAQGKGFGSKLLKEIIYDTGFERRIICLETSTVKNISWYEKFGFRIYNKLELGYELFFMKKE